MQWSLLLWGLLSASLAAAQAETVYLTQVQYIYTACECFGTAAAALPSASSLPRGSLSASTSSSIAGGSGSSPASSLPAGAATTLTATFPSFGSLSTVVATETPFSPTPGQALSLTSSAETVASVVSVSGGLGPLLSSSTPTTYTASTSSTGPVLSVPYDAGSTSIQVISTTFSATAASSHLSTSGIPEPLTVSLGGTGSKTTAGSSAGLISFGSSSPAVFSTILPSGVTMGTSSALRTTYSTITLSSVSLTGVTLLAPRSPTSCFTLPTPSSSMDLIALAVVPLDDFDLTNPMMIALGNNGTTPQYISALASGNPYVLDLSLGGSVTGQLGLQIPGDEALVFDGSGMSLYTGNCSTLTQVIVDNFYDQLISMHAPVTPRRLATTLIEDRQSLNSSAFNVDVALDSYLNTPSFSPSLTFGDALCAPGSITSGASFNNMSWSCLYPPPVGGVASCALELSSWLNEMTAPSKAPVNTTEVLATLGPFLTLAGDSILDLFPGSDPALGLGFTFMRQAEAAAKDIVGYGGSSPCDIIHAFDSNDLVIEDFGPLGTQTVGSFMTAPPPSVAVNLAATATSAFTALPPRKANPTDGFVKQIVTDFGSVYGAFTHWLHGIPLLGGLVPPLGMEETGTRASGAVLTGPVGTFTSAAVPATSSIVQDKIPTLTVTHVLGDGWFSPSTYVVGPETSIGQPFPGRASQSSGDHETSTFGSAADYVSGSASAVTYASPHVVAQVVSQLEAMSKLGPGVQRGRRWELSESESTAIGIATTDIPLAQDGHVVVITTTITILGDTFDV